MAHAGRALGALLLAGATAVSLADPSAQPPRFRQNIIIPAKLPGNTTLRGIPVKPGQFPYAARVEVGDVVGDAVGGVVGPACGGTAIRAAFVITAGSCVRREGWQRESDIKVFMGLLYWSQRKISPYHAFQPQRRNAKKIYTTTPSDGNIGLIEVDPPFEQNAWVGFAPLVAAGRLPVAAERLIVLGYSDTNLRGNASELYDALSFISISPIECANYDCNAFCIMETPRTQNCTYRTALRDVSLCLSDVGSAVMAGKASLSLIAFSQTAWCEEDTMTVTVQPLGRHIGWIDSKIGTSQGS